MSDGHIKISTKIDTDGVKGQFEELRQLISEFGGNAEAELNQKLDELVMQFDKLGNKLDEEQQSIQKYKAEMQSLQSTINMYETGQIPMDAGYAKSQQELKAVSDLLAKAEQNASELEVRMNGVEVKAGQMSQKLQSGTKATSDIDKGMKRVEQSSNNVAKSVNSGVNKLGRYALALFSIRSIYGGLSKLANNWLNSNDAAAEKTKAQIEQITSMLSSLLAPVIMFIANAIATLMGYLNAVLKFFFGIEMSTKNTGKNTKNMNKGVKETDKSLKRIITGFDEVEKLSSETADNMSDAGTTDLGVVIPEPDTSIIEKWANKMKSIIDSIWSDPTFQSYFNSLLTIASVTFNGIVSLAANLWSNIVLTWNEMLPELQRGFDTLVEFWRRVLEDIAVAVSVWIPQIVMSLNTFVDSVFATFRPLLVFIAQLWSDFGNIMLTLCNEYGAGILGEIGRFIDGVVKLFTMIWTHVIDPIISPAIKMIKRLWDEHLKDLVLEFGRFVGDIITAAMKFVNGAIIPMITWVVEKLGPVISWLSNTIFPVLGSVFGAVGNQISNVISMLRGAFGGLVEFISGAFTGDWSRAWNGVVQIFWAIVSGIGNMFKTPLNWIIDGLNFFIRQVNRIKIPSWVPGIGGFGIDIPQVQRLQRGGIVNRPTEAIIGDGGREAVIPIENDTRALEEIAGILAANGAVGGNQGNLTINIGASTIINELLDELKRRQMSSNGGVVLDI